MPDKMTLMTKFDAKASIAKINSLADALENRTREAVEAAFEVGWALIEIKESLPHGDWLEWVQTNTRLKERTARRCKELAEKTIEHAGVERASLPVPMSRLLSLPEAEVTEPVREARQLVLDFMADKTMGECIRGYVVEGDDITRITRAANGKKLGGSKGEDRKDFPKFIATALGTITDHLTVRGKSKAKYREFEADQQAKIGASFDAAVGQWPRWLVEVMKSAATREAKLSDAERATKIGGRV